jgi:anti-sigma regulatory factor (Ser/Thr protein kinase)
MHRVLKYTVKNNADLLFAKRDLFNFLKEKLNSNLLNVYIFAVMELGTNLFKHASRGEIWLLKEDNDYLIAVLDKGGGIKDLEWALQKGTTSYKNSLGVGLYQLINNEFIDLRIFSSTEVKGSVFLITPKRFSKSYTCFSLNYMDINLSGDFCVKKGKFFLVGDVSGHGIRANRSAEFIKKYFLNTPFSCLLVREFFEKLHNLLKEKELRSAVLSIVEYTKNSLLICGIGNIGVFKKHMKNIEVYMQKPGIVGESFSSVSNMKIVLDKNVRAGVFTDGVEAEILKKVLEKSDDIFIIAICSIYFSEVNDDKTILVFKGEVNE